MTDSNQRGPIAPGLVLDFFPTLCNADQFFWTIFFFVQHRIIGQCIWTICYFFLQNHYFGQIPNWPLPVSLDLVHLTSTGCRDQENGVELDRQ